MAQLACAPIVALGCLRRLNKTTTYRYLHKTTYRYLHSLNKTFWSCTKQARHEVSVDSHATRPICSPSHPSPSTPIPASQSVYEALDTGEARPTRGSLARPTRGSMALPGARPPARRQPDSRQARSHGKDSWLPEDARRRQHLNACHALCALPCAGTRRLRMRRAERSGCVSLYASGAERGCRERYVNTGR